MAYWDSTSGPVDGRVTALAQWLRDGNARPGDAQRAREHGAHAARAHAQRARRVGGAADRSRGAGRGLRAPRARAVLARPARRHSPLVRRARSPAHGGAQRRRRRDVRAGRRGRRAAAAHLPAPARAASGVRRREGRGQGRPRLRAPDDRRGAGLLTAGAGGPPRRDVRPAIRSRWRATPPRRSRPSTASRTGPSCWISSASRTSASSRCA